MHERGAKGLYLFNLFMHPQDGPVWNGVLSGRLEPRQTLTLIETDRFLARLGLLQGDPMPSAPSTSGRLVATPVETLKRKSP